MFSFGYGVAWNGTLWVAVGSGTFSIAYSSDGINWTGVTGSTSIFSYGYGVAWNGLRFVAVGSGTFSIAYSSDGINWTGVTDSNTIFLDSYGNANSYGVAWNGTRFVAVGSGITYKIAYSSDGMNWTGVTGSMSIFSEYSSVYGVAGNPKVGATIVPSAIHLNNNLNTNSLTFSSESYYQSGVNNITIGVTSNPI